jgi:hypothetical protein
MADGEQQRRPPRRPYWQPYTAYLYPVGGVDEILPVGEVRSVFFEPMAASPEQHSEARNGREGAFDATLAREMGPREEAAETTDDAAEAPRRPPAAHSPRRARGVDEGGHLDLLA